MLENQKILTRFLSHWVCINYGLFIGIYDFGTVDNVFIIYSVTLLVLVKNTFRIDELWREITQNTLCEF